MSNYKAAMSVEQLRLRDEVMQLWARHQSWPRGVWPKDRRHDLIQIQHYVKLLALPLDFWREAIGRVPAGAAFRWLTTGPAPGHIGRLEEWATLYIRQRNQREQEIREELTGQVVDPAFKARVDDMIGTLSKQMRVTA